MTHPVYDLAVIGGGINGTGIAADAAGRGLKVVLAEMGDLGGATSSASSKLIHGGLRYLEHFEFRLVREALTEREVLLAKAPHIIWPLRFVIPQTGAGRSALMLRAGLLLYDHLGRRRRIPGSASIDLADDPAGVPLRRDLHRGFAYWDCWVDDARLVIANAQAAAENGALILTRTRVEAIAAAGGHWRLSLGGEPREIEARALVNAAGPWADAVGRLVQDGGRSCERRLRLVKGSHIVVPRIAPGNDAYLLQSKEGRVVFALPFEGHFTLIGTTDVPYAGDPGGAAITPEETRYLLEVVNSHLASPIGPEAIVWTYSGVRPLYDDDAHDEPSEISRDYHLALTAREGMPPLLTVLGGKITTYRKLAETALSDLAPHLPAMGPAWTASAPLPGGELDARGFDGLLDDLARRWPQFPADMLRRLARRYGARAEELLGDARTQADLGEALAGGLTPREVEYLKRKEWARTPDDILWRRTKIGLHMTPGERRNLGEAITRLL